MFPAGPRSHSLMGRSSLRPTYPRRRDQARPVHRGRPWEPRHVRGASLHRPRDPAAGFGWRGQRRAGGTGGRAGLAALLLLLAAGVTALAVDPGAVPQPSGPMRQPGISPQDENIAPVELRAPDRPAVLLSPSDDPRAPSPVLTPSGRGDEGAQREQRRSDKRRDRKAEPRTKQPAEEERSQRKRQKAKARVCA